jgi:hypothetical protein
VAAELRIGTALLRAVLRLKKELVRFWGTFGPIRSDRFFCGTPKSFLPRLSIKNFNQIYSSHLFRRFNVVFIIFTERRGRAVSIPASFFGNSRVKISARRPAILSLFGFPRSLQANAEVLP